MTGIAELLRGVGSQPSETPPPLWDVPGVEPDFDVIVVGGVWLVPSRRTS